MKLQPVLKDTRKDKLFQKGFDYHKLRTVPSPQAILPEIDKESRHKSFYFFPMDHIQKLVLATNGLVSSDSGRDIALGSHMYNFTTFFL